MIRPILLATALTMAAQCPWDTDPEPDVVEAVAVPPLAAADDGMFATSSECRDCHSNFPAAQAMRDNIGRPVGMYDLWSGSMMANAARDPLWRAVVSAEIKATPAARSAIEAKCMRCHSPMASEDVALTDKGPMTLSLLTSETGLGNLALDGVSCALCHQIDGDNLGSTQSFSGGFKVTQTGIAHGPHQDPYGQGMTQTSGYEPIYVDYTTQSDFCAPCHNLTTDTLTEQGLPTGDVLHEQAAYLEWLNSAYAAGPGLKSCQDCHMPTSSEDNVTIATEIARGRNGQDISALYARSPYGRHVFVGGNTLLPAIFRDNQETLNPLAGPEAFTTTMEATRRHLEDETAFVNIADAHVDGSTLNVEVAVESITGHKLPTGIPIRRMWLYLEVVDSEGAVVFQSGAYDRTGQIVGPDGSPLPFEAADGPIEAHHDRITSMTQVQIYEAVMAGVDGQPTFTLLRGADYYKDNRILPPGWSTTFERIADIAPRGVEGDGDFAAGGDRVSYEVPVGRFSAPFTVTTRLLFQPLSQRFASELWAVDTAEIRAFKAMWEGVLRTPEIIDTDVATAP